MPNNPLDVTLDSLLWVSSTAFSFSLCSHLLRSPQVAFAAGAIAGVGFVLLVGVGQVRPELRSIIAYRIAQTFVGVALGVMA